MMETSLLQERAKFLLKARAKLLNEVQEIQHELVSTLSAWEKEHPLPDSQYWEISASGDFRVVESDDKCNFTYYDGTMCGSEYLVSMKGSKTRCETHKDE